MTDEKPVWQPIETAPKDGTVVLIASKGNYAGTMMAKFCALVDFMTELGLDQLRADGVPDADLEDPDWFYADFETGGRVNLDPTHWMPLPEPPEEA